MGGARGGEEDELLVAIGPVFAEVEENEGNENEGGELEEIWVGEWIHCLLVKWRCRS